MTEAQAAWLFVGTLAVLSIVMVLALVSFTAALIASPKPRSDKAAGLGEVRAALLALNKPEWQFRLVPLSDTEMRLDWHGLDASWYELFAKVKLTISYRARLLLYEPDHEVRCHETLRSSNHFMGFQGLRPRFHWDFYYRSGALNVIWSGLAYGIKKAFPPQIGQVYQFSLDTVAPKRDIAEAARGLGWAFRPVPLKFETTSWGVAMGERLTPAFARGWSPKRFWGSLYAATWAAIIALCLVYIPWTTDNVVILTVFPAIFWGFQAFFVWAWKAMERHSARKGRG